LKGIVVTFVALWTMCCSGGWQVEAAADAFLPPPYGPLRLVNQQPTQLLFSQSFPEEARVTPPGHVGVHLNAALSNTLVRKEGEVTAELDVEMVRTVIDVRYGVQTDFEMGLEIPFSGPRSPRRPSYLDDDRENAGLDTERDCNQGATSPSLALHFSHGRGFGRGGSLWQRSSKQSTVAIMIATNAGRAASALTCLHDMARCTPRGSPSAKRPRC
jgi:hypothetical protein